MWGVVVGAAYVASVLMFVMSAATVAAVVPVRHPVRKGRLTIGRVYNGRPLRAFRDAVLALFQSGLTIYLTSLMTPGTRFQVTMQGLAYAVSLLTVFFLLRDTVGALPIFVGSGYYVFFPLAVVTGSATILFVLTFFPRLLFGDNQVLLDYRTGDRAVVTQQCNINPAGASCLNGYAWNIDRLPGHIDSTFDVSTAYPHIFRPGVATIQLVIPGAGCPVSWSAWTDGRRLAGTENDVAYVRHLSISVKTKALRIRADWTNASACTGRISLSTLNN